MTDEMDPAERVRRLVDEARRRREKHKRVRAEFDAARAAGLRRRHATKLARLRVADVDDHLDDDQDHDDDGPTAA